MTLLRRWPLPALGAWLAAWALWWALGRAGASPALAFAAAACLGVAAAALAARWPETGRWRQALIAVGFPASALAAGAAAWLTLPAWAWLAPLALLALAYPWRAWRDAPFFPTPRGALAPLAAAAPLPAGAQVHDAGCGLGHGLRDLHAAYPAATISGTEWSRPLAWACARRCPWATVRRGDLWADDWSTLDLVYLFQRPESMPRAWDKARAELRPGAWLASLEFEVPGQTPVARLDGAGGRPVWLYRPRGAASAASRAGRGAGVQNLTDGRDAA